MKSPKPTSENLDDLIFENRNKLYGAYFLRSTYNATLKKAFTLSMAFAALVILILAPAAFKNPSGPIALPDADSIRVIQVFDVERPQEEMPAVATHTVSNPSSEVFQPVNEIVPLPRPAVNPAPDPGNEIPNTQGTQTSATTTNGNEGNQSATSNTGSTAGSGSTETNTTYSWATEMPEFNGGEAAMKRYIITHFRVPNDADGDNIKIRMFFVVDENGKITDIKIVKGASEELNEEAIRVVASMPDWKPGKMGSRAVKVRYSLPITIKLQ